MFPEKWIFTEDLNKKRQWAKQIVEWQRKNSEREMDEYENGYYSKYYNKEYDEEEPYKNARIEVSLDILLKRK